MADAKIVSLVDHLINQEAAARHVEVMEVYARLDKQMYDINELLRVVELRLKTLEEELDRRS